MAGQSKRDPGGAPPPDRDLNEPTNELEAQSSPEFVVARGRTVQVAGKPQGPGTPIDLPEDELEHLLAAGFIVRIAEEPSVGAGVRVGGLQIKGGRKPGGTIA
jgi:hypothetical protein